MIPTNVVEGMYFDSVFHPETAREMTLNQYIDKVRSQEFAARIRRLRGLIQAGKKQEATDWKKQFPLFVAGGVMKGGRRLEHLVQYSRCICIDIDDSPIPSVEMCRIAQTLSYVKAGHVSPSGTGYKLFILVDSPLELHAYAFETLRRRLEKEIPGIRVDTSGKDPNRGCFVSYDPLAFIKAETERVHIDASPRKAAPARIASAERGLSAYLAKFEQDNPFVAGSRHQFVVKLSAQLNSVGFALEEVLGECLRRYVGEDFSAKEVEQTVRDVYRRYSASFGEKSSKSSVFSGGISGGGQSSKEGTESAVIEPNEFVLPHFDRAIYDRLPPLLADAVCKAHDPEERDVMLLAALTLLGSAMHAVNGSLAEHEQFPCLFTAVLGPSGSGKGCVASMHKLIEPWHRYVYDRSRQEVLVYLRKKQDYERTLQNSRRNERRSGQLTLELPDMPDPVKQKDLNVFGYVSLARLLELLEDNSPYASCLYETEMESLTQTMGQDFGGYGYLLNQVAHHERAGSASKTGGTHKADIPKMALFVTGTDNMFRQLVPSTENGTFSRLLIYKLTGDAVYRDLTAADDTRQAADYFAVLGQRVLKVALHLDKSPTWVKYSEAQRKRLNRFFNREYDRVRAFGNEDLASTVLRGRMAAFRIGQILTGLRKAEAGELLPSYTMTDEDCDTGLSIVKVCLQHAYLVSTMLKRPKKTACYKFPYVQQKLFADMPEKFKWAELQKEANVRGVPRTTLFRMIKKCEALRLIVSLGAGYYQKTMEGKQVSAPGNTPG